MNSTSKAIAISAIWIGVGLSAMAGDVVGFVALMAVLPTMVIASRNN